MFGCAPCGLLFVAALIAGALGGGNQDDDTSTADTERRVTTTTTEAVELELPAYEVRPRGERELVVLTDELDAEVLRAIFDQVREDYRDNGDSWIVSINCASIPSSEAADPRTANGKFANTTTGLAQTGLASTDDVEFDTTGLDSCAPPETTTTAAPPPTEPPTTAPPTTPAPTTAPPTVATSTYYASCAEARADGAAPLRRGDPGYSTDLDRDGDGVACET